MTDPFADLERELLAAHARGARRRASPRVFAIAATAAAAIAAVAWLGAQSDPERVASTPQAATAGGACEDGPWQPPVTQDAVPPELAERLEFLRGDSRERVDHRFTGSQATRLYGLPVRLAHRGGYDVRGVAADIVPRAQMVRPREPCAPSPGDARPGVCLMLVDERGDLAACFTVEELLAGEAFVDVRGSIVGLAPDGAEWAVSGENRAEVEGNVFALPGGPGAQVDFEPEVTG